MKKFCLLFALLLVLLSAKAIIVPRDSAVLTYTHVVFEFPAVPKAEYYRLQFKKAGEREYFHTQYDSTHVSFCSFFDFGEEYEWKYTAFSEQSSVLFESKIFHFSVSGQRAYDTVQYAGLLRGNYTSKGLVAIDQSKNLIDFGGREVWRIPQLKNFPPMNKLNMRDLRMTKSGTFTAIITSSNAVEFDRDGNVIWTAPESWLDKENGLENYHHDFRKLNRGTYMVMSQKEADVYIDTTNKAISEALKAEMRNLEKGNLNYREAFGTIIEYSEKGEIVWTWNSKDFLTERIYNGWNPVPAHSNAFYFDEENNHLYYGFRNINLIVKVEYPSGKVLASFGAKLSSNHKVMAENTFALQHSIELRKNGDILIFNNDSADVEQVQSSLLILNEQLSKQDKIVKQISCAIDNQDSGKALKYGSAEELPDGTLLLGIGGTGRAVVLDPSKNYEVVKDISLKIYEKDNWVPLVFYRCHYSPSMYPCYFSVKASTQGIDVVNEGSEPDAYNVNVTFKEGGKRIYKVPELTSEQKYRLNLDLSKVSSAEVVSYTDNRMKRKLKL